MEQVDIELKQERVSIFHTSMNAPELKMTMRDFASLAGVLKELGTEQIYESPIDIMRFLNIIQLLHEASLGITDPIENVEMIYYRYQHTYLDNEPPDIKYINHIIHILDKNNWLTKQTRQIKLLSRGKRMMDALIRLANDSLAYYLEDDIGRSLFQARRDAEISEAYDDNGISGGNTIASMIMNVEEAIEKLEERQLEYLADRNALPQLEVIHKLMLELETKMKERLAQFQTVEDSLVMSELIQRGVTTITKGTALSLGVLTKYIRFITMQNTPKGNTISPERIRNFIINMYNPPVDSNIPNAHEIFSFMEQETYENESMDGIWIPVKFASQIGATDILDAIDYLETYEPRVNDPLDDEEEVDYIEEEISGSSVDQLFEQASWQMTKAVIDTEKIEEYLTDHGEVELEELIVEASSTNWGDAIRSLLAVSALSNNQKVEVQKNKSTKTYNKEWEWIQDDDKQYNVRGKGNQRQPVDSHE